MNKWSRASWQMLASFALNAMWSEPRALPKGKWSGAKRVVAGAMAESIERFSKYGQTELSDFEGLEKELLSKRVSYTGEEVHVCSKLSFEQVLPALPPHSHGGAIDVLNFVSPAPRTVGG